MGFAVLFAWPLREGAMRCVTWPGVDVGRKADEAHRINLSRSRRG